MAETMHFLPSNESMTRKHETKKSNRNKTDDHFNQKINVC
jgi:hypothetical protein